MIRAVVIVNNHGKARLTKFYEYLPDEKQQQFVRECFMLVSRRDENQCAFVQGATALGSDTKLIYRIYATLFFVFCVDESESELGTLDLIQVFVETLDFIFENVCELHLIFNMEKVRKIVQATTNGRAGVTDSRVTCLLNAVLNVSLQIHYVLDEIVVGGLVLETNMSDIIAALQDAKREEVSSAPRSLSSLVK